MKGSCVEVLFQRFHLRDLRLATVNATVEKRRQRLAELDRGRKYPLRILLPHRTPQLSSLFRGQQPQLPNQAEKISISRQQVCCLCGKSQVQCIDEFQRRVPGEQFERFGSRTHFSIITPKNSFKGYR